MNFKNIIIKIIPNKLIRLIIPVFSVFENIHFKKKIKKLRSKQSNLIKVIKLKDKIDVFFFVIHDSIWKYEEVYKLLDNDPKFNVKVVVIPLVRNNIGQMETYYQSLEYFNERKYNTLGAYDEENKLWLDVKKLTNPDVVFFANPHKLTFDKYYINNYLDKLTCYVPYNFVVMHPVTIQYDQKFHHLLWKFFLETNRHKVFADQFKLNNSIITGFPGLDTIFNNKYKKRNPWKNFNNHTLKIIWAPHHSIEGQGSILNYSNFKEYCNFFLEYTEKNKNVQIAFKPHPLLKENLYKDKDWGKELTDNYYSKWNSLVNGQLEEGNYIDLFYHSDAMILDSGSFIAEYLYFDKPIMFTKKDSKIFERFNSFGQEVFNYLYHANNKSDIQFFISDTLIKGSDKLKESRNQFLNEVILPKNKKTASKNIYKELKNELC